MKRTKFYIEAFLPKLNGWFPAHTYAGFSSADAAKAKFLEMNPMHAPENVRVIDAALANSERTDG